ncbi:MAG: MBL fold metallo-hydrolase, partial [Terriglobales bacterium]
MFFEPRNRLLVSGDALWENGMGFVWPERGANPYVEAALATLARIEALAPAVVIPGHGAPFTDAKGSVANVRLRLEAYARDPQKNARHVVKVMFAFALLDRQSMPEAEVAGYLGRIGCYRELSQAFLGMDDVALATWLLADLTRAGAIAVNAGVVSPTARA